MNDPGQPGSDKQRQIENLEPSDPFRIPRTRGEHRIETDRKTRPVVRARGGAILHGLDLLRHEVEDFSF